MLRGVYAVVSNAVTDQKTSVAASVYFVFDFGASARD